MLGIYSLSGFSPFLLTNTQRHVFFPPYPGFCASPELVWPRPILPGSSVLLPVSGRLNHVGCVPQAPLLKGLWSVCTLARNWKAAGRRRKGGKASGVHICLEHKWLQLLMERSDIVPTSARWHYPWASPTLSLSFVSSI